MNTPERFPVDDEQACDTSPISKEMEDFLHTGKKPDEFVTDGEHEDIVWESLEKTEQKIRDHFERENEQYFEERKPGG